MHSHVLSVRVAEGLNTSRCVHENTASVLFKFPFTKEQSVRSDMFDLELLLGNYIMIRSREEGRASPW